MENSTISTLKTIHHYIDRYALPNIQIEEKPAPNLGLIVVIPAFKEPDILTTLHSLLSCNLPGVPVEIIVVLNYPENSSEDVITKTEEDYLTLKTWSQKHSTDAISFHILLSKNLPIKQAGPGLARKIGMDEAIRRFADISKPNGIIVGLDADCEVEPNYLTSIYRHWQTHPDCNGISIRFEHPLEGTLSTEVYEGIINYELHLRYYINAQLYCNFPYAYHTVGSSFAVTAQAYAKQGGMNKRKAGEDFYFIQKIVPLGNYFNLNDTIVKPSPRSSDRVPFGTGRSIQEYLSTNSGSYFTYNFQSFIDLKKFLDISEGFYQWNEEDTEKKLRELPQSILSFLDQQDFIQHLRLIKSNTSSSATFRKAFYRWFNAFTLMKYVHYARDYFYPNVEVSVAVNAYLKADNKQKLVLKNKKEMLLWMRAKDRELFQIK